MSGTNPTLAIISQGWQAYQKHVVEAITPLSVEQLALSAAPSLRSIDEIARHIIATRAAWFHAVLRVGDDDFAAFASWDTPDSVARSADELTCGLTTTWDVMQEALGGFSPDDLQANVHASRNGRDYTFVRGWVVWHVIEHDLHHGGELAYSLGIHGLAAPTI